MAKHRKISKIVVILLVVAIIIGGACTFVANNFEQEIKDFKAGLDYKPSESMAQIISNMDLTWRASNILRSTHPALEGPRDFVDHCVDEDYPMITNACHSFEDNRIYVYNVDSELFPGFKESNLAHELLHAIYYRLSDSEKAEINVELDSFYQSHQDQLFAYIDGYTGEQYYNELHSYICQRVHYDDLSASLQKYYARYFKNPSKIAEFYDSYENVWNAKQKQLDDSFAKIEEEYDRVSAWQEDYIKRYETYVASPNRTPQLDAAFEAEQEELSAAIRQFNDHNHVHDALREEIFAYFDKIDARKALEAENAD